MTNMKTERGEKDQPVMAEGYDYPCGLCLFIDEDSIKKLGLKELPDLGAILVLEAKVKVTKVSDENSVYGRYRGMSLQVTDMELESEADDKAEGE